MPSFNYNRAVKEILDRTLDITTGLKIMLVKSGYTPNQDDDVVDAGGANDAVDHELSVTGYTPGWGGAGRKSTTATVAEDDANNRATINLTNVSWTALGTGQTIVGAILIKEGVANDTTSRLITYLDLVDTPTNGGDITLNFTGNQPNIAFNN